MVKIEGWKKTKDTKAIQRWVYQRPGQGTTTVPIQRTEVAVYTLYKTYPVEIILWTGKSSLPFVRETFYKKKEAEDFAMKYMRSHPRG